MDKNINIGKGFYAFNAIKLDNFLYSSLIHFVCMQIKLFMKILTEIVIISISHPWRVPIIRLELSYIQIDLLMNVCGQYFSTKNTKSRTKHTRHMQN
jgi:hypothetical protein